MRWIREVVGGGEELQQQLEEIRTTIEIKRSRYPERREKTVRLCSLGGENGGKSFTSRHSTHVYACVFEHMCAWNRQRNLT